MFNISKTLMLRIGIFGVFGLLLLACNKDSLTLPDEDADTVGGASEEQNEFWEYDMTSDTALSTLSGKELLNHLKGLSEYMDHASKKVKRKNVQRLESLPPVVTKLKSADDLQFYQVYMNKKNKFGKHTWINGNSKMPFQELSTLAIQIQLVNIKMNLSEKPEQLEVRP